MFEAKTVNDAFLLAAGRGDKTAWLWLDAGGTWQPISSAQVYGRVRALAGVLAGWGIGKGDRVAILSENRWEWAVTDFAVLALGAVDVPLYSTLTADQAGYMLRDSGAKIAVVSNGEMLAKLWDAGELPDLQRIVMMDRPGGPSETPQESATQAQAMRLPVPVWFGTLIADADAMQASDAAFDGRVRAARGDDLATIIYTSGTTGEPKGVALTHGNLASNFSVSTPPFGFSERDAYLSFLPLSHIFERHVDYALMCDGATIAYCTRFDLLPTAMKAVRPTVFVAVPRVYEKIMQGVEAKSTGLKRRILRWALATGRRHRAEILGGTRPTSLRWKLADRLVFSKIAEAFGGRARTFISGGAALGVDTAGWFLDADIRIFEGYGLTETSPVVSFNYPGSVRMGTIGRPLANVELRVAPDGELELRGPSVFRSYWRKEKETAEAFTQDGWFCTGDVVTLDADGFLSITDRKKELLKTSGGKLIAPQPIENRLKANSLVGAAALVGDNHKFACALISPNFAVLERWASERGIPTADPSVLIQDVRVIALYREIVDGVNRTLAPFENVKRLKVVAEEWTVEGGELTPSMKLKRRVVQARYAVEIDEFYKDEATASR